MSEEAKVDTEEQTESIGETVHQVREQLVENFHDLEDQYLTARDQVYDLNRKAVDFIQQHPGATIAGAFAVGYLIGKLAKRRWWI